MSIFQTAFFTKCHFCQTCVTRYWEQSPRILMLRRRETRRNRFGRAPRPQPPREGRAPARPHGEPPSWRLAASARNRRLIVQSRDPRLGIGTDATSTSSNRMCGSPAYGIPLSAFHVVIDFYLSFAFEVIVYDIFSCQFRFVQKL